MHQQSDPDQASKESRKYRLRWWTLSVLSMGLLVTVVDTIIVNVAIPTLQRELGASSSELQWIIDSYILVLAGLLLTMGSLADRFGRKRGMLIGMVILGLSSGLAAYSTDTEQLIAARTIMGLGAAMIMPPTLSIIVDVFPVKKGPKPSASGQASPPSACRWVCWSAGRYWTISGGGLCSCSAYR